MSPADSPHDIPSDEITRLLDELRLGRPGAQEELIPIIYEQLHHLARAHMAWERPDHTLQTTALVHEAYIRLLEARGSKWVDRGHFFSAASEIMRHILVDHARKRQARKRGGGVVEVELKDDLAISDQSLDRILIVQEALEALKAQDPRQAHVVVLRIFGGLGHAQIADILHVSVKTVKRDWKHAQAWLYREIFR